MFSVALCACMCGSGRTAVVVLLYAVGEFKSWEVIRTSLASTCRMLSEHVGLLLSQLTLPGTENAVWRRCRSYVATLTGMYQLLATT